jgi:hypothetical protein
MNFQLRLWSRDSDVNQRGESWSIVRPPKIPFQGDRRPAEATKSEI